VASTANDGPAGTLLAVNVGGPRDVAWQGRTVRTAIWYRTDSYRYWSEHLDRQDFTSGLAEGTTGGVRIVAAAKCV